MLERLLTEQSNPDSRNLDESSTVHLLEIMNAADAQVAAAVAREIPRIAAAAEAIARAVERGGSLLYIGAGTSGRLGVLDAS
jgi:N-acetylmuramic acid 6-phosphate etherase